jgi:membrane protein
MSSLKRLFKPVMGLFLVRFLRVVFSEFSRDDAAVYSASVAYYAFLSIFPLFIGLVGLMGYILPAQDFQSRIMDFISNNLPGQAQNIQNLLNQAIQNRGVLSIVGLLGALWTGSTLLTTLGHAINRCWDVPVDPPVYIAKPRDVGLTIGFGILFALALILVSGSALFSLPDFASATAVLIKIGAVLLSIILLFSIFLVLFKIMPNTRTYWRHIWFGAAVTAVLFSAGNGLLLIFFNNFSNYSQLYGPVATIVVLLVWIYYSGLIVLIGAEFTAEYGRMRRGMPAGMIAHSAAQPAGA